MQTPNQPYAIYMLLTKLATKCVDEKGAREYLESLRWPGGAVCPHCQSDGESFRLSAHDGSKRPVREGVWKCGVCRKQFSVTVGTALEGSHIPLHKWLLAIHLLGGNEKGLSGRQLQRMLPVSYSTAWYMIDRIRWASQRDPLLSKLRGTGVVPGVGRSEAKTTLGRTGDEEAFRGAAASQMHTAYRRAL